MYYTPDVIVLTRTNRGFLSRSSEWRGQHFLLAEEMALPPLSSSSRHCCSSSFHRTLLAGHKGTPLARTELELGIGFSSDCWDVQWDKQTKQNKPDKPEKRYKQTSQGPRREEGADVQAENHISGVRQACQGSKPQSRDSLWITHHHSKHHYATQTTLYYSQTILHSLWTPHHIL